MIPKPSWMRSFWNRYTSFEMWHSPITCLSEPFNEANSKTFSNSHTQRREACLHCKGSETALPRWSSQLWYHYNMNTYTSVLGILCILQQYNVWPPLCQVQNSFATDEDLKTLYYYNLLCYVKCSTSLLTFKADAISLYHIMNAISLYHIMNAISLYHIMNAISLYHIMNTYTMQYVFVSWRTGA